MNFFKWKFKNEIFKITLFKWSFLNESSHIRNESIISSKLFRSFGGNINVKVDLSNYATKTDLKNLTHVDTSSFAQEKLS